MFLGTLSRQVIIRAVMASGLSPIFSPLDTAGTLPLIGEHEFGLTSKTAIVSFIVSFGITKALCNLFAARLSETWGRKHVLVLGWLIGLPVPFMIIWAQHWWWFDIANVLLGVNQAL